VATRRRKGLQRQAATSEEPDAIRLLTALAATLVVALPTSTPWFTVQATSYSPCSSGTITASGLPVHFGVVAMNTLPFGTHIEITPPAFGRSTFTVEDRIGSGSQLDIFQPNCIAAIGYGRRSERVRVIKHVPPTATQTTR
jgi:3D (Asp-Asp-Asp) domain-containing protein